MNCRKARRIIGMIPDRPLTDTERTDLLQHTGSCKSCNELYLKMEHYGSVISKLSELKPPEGMRERTIERMKQAAEGSRSSIISTRIRILQRVAAAAVLLITIGIAVLIPGRRVSLDTEFNLMQAKGSKGPPKAEKSNRVSDERVALIYSIAEMEGVIIKGEMEGAVAGRPDGIRLLVEAAVYDSFIERYNSISSTGSLEPLAGEYRWRKVALNIWITEKIFFAGDFNGDGKDDFGYLVTRGKERGTLFRMIGAGDGSFGREVPLSDNGAVEINPERSILVLAGDINRDRLDDVILFTSGIDGADMQILITDHEKIKGTISDVASPFGSEVEDGLVYSGDFNGDGYTDLGFPVEDQGGAVVWHAALNSNGKGFLPPLEMKTRLVVPGDAPLYSHLVIDINGDGLSDTGLYIRSGEKDATWPFSVNMGDGEFGEAVNGRFPRGIMAFQGDYLPLPADINGDGFDDLLVKMGRSGEDADWYLMINQGDTTFVNSGMAQFYNPE